MKNFGRRHALAAGMGLAVSAPAHAQAGYADHAIKLDAGVVPEILRRAGGSLAADRAGLGRQGGVGEQPDPGRRFNTRSGQEVL